MNLPELKQKRKVILDLARKHGVEELRVFGSVAKGMQRNDSDINFLARFNRKSSLFELAALIDDLEDLLGCRVDVVSENELHYYIKDQVLSEAVSL